MISVQLLIAEFANGRIMECAGSKCDGEISILHEQMTHYYTGNSILCNSMNCNKLNYVHQCDICRQNYWINWIVNYGEFIGLDDEWSNHVCSQCFATPWYNLVKVCYACSFQCDECDEKLCLEHVFEDCILCDRKYCHCIVGEYGPTDYMRTCRCCGHRACKYCRVYFTIECNAEIQCDLYGVCNRCYSEEIATQHPSPKGYKMCLDIVDRIDCKYNPFSILEMDRINYIIAMYIGIRSTILPKEEIEYFFK
jgi:hypothetical protein